MLYKAPPVIERLPTERDGRSAEPRLPLMAAGGKRARGAAQKLYSSAAYWVATGLNWGPGAHRRYVYIYVYFYVDLRTFTVPDHTAVNLSFSFFTLPREYSDAVNWPSILLVNNRS